MPRRWTAIFAPFASQLKQTWWGADKRDRWNRRRRRTRRSSETGLTQSSTENNVIAKYSLISM